MPSEGWFVSASVCLLPHFLWLRVMRQQNSDTITTLVSFYRHYNNIVTIIQIDSKDDKKMWRVQTNDYDTTNDTAVHTVKHNKVTHNQLNQATGCILTENKANRYPNNINAQLLPNLERDVMCDVIMGINIISFPVSASVK